jgi:hypothetical protein
MINVSVEKTKLFETQSQSNQINQPPAPRTLWGSRGVNIKHGINFHITGFDRPRRRSYDIWPVQNNRKKFGRVLIHRPCLAISRLDLLPHHIKHHH